MTWSSPASNQPPDPRQGTRSATAELRIEGMHCASCVALVEEVLAEQSGVTSARVDLESGLAVVHYDQGVIGSDQLRAAIAEVGYTAAMVG